MPENRLTTGSPTKKQATSSTIQGLVSSPRTDRRSVVVIGSAADVPRALEHPAVAAGQLHVESLFTIEVDAVEQAELSAELSGIIQERNVSALLIAGPLGSSAMRVVADVALLHHCDLLAVMPTEVFAEHDPIVVWTGDRPLVQLTRVPKRRFALTIKRAIDVVGASVGLIVSGPVIAVLAVLVRLESPGSPIFAHRRVGLQGKPFDCFKLRTMRTGAEDLLKADPKLYEEYRRNHFKLPDDRDPRTTRIGQILRRTSLDELPQFWNVLRGDMSLVGPRPVVNDELSMYDHSVDLLLSVRPGLTGAWAVNGRHDVGYPDRCAIELAYVRNWRLGADVGILARTVGVVITGLTR